MGRGKRREVYGEEERGEKRRESVRTSGVRVRNTSVVVITVNRLP
jgi:hypothetical protein